MLSILIFLLQFWSAITNFVHIGYCNLPCFKNHKRIDNVVCTNFPCLPSYLCGRFHKLLPLNDSERDFVLNLHNEYRNRVASGKERRGGNGAAADMLVMSYDKELEFMALCWSNQCQEHPVPSLGRDECRATVRFHENGQNHWADADANASMNWEGNVHLQRAIDSWYSGVEYTTTSIVSSFTSDDSPYEFFTQMVWADTFLIGCGRTKFNSNKYIGINVICNYGPTGNVRGESVYYFGKPCSRYDHKDIHPLYSSLCGSIRPFEKDTFRPPFTISGQRLSSSIGFVFVMYCLILLV